MRKNTLTVRRAFGFTLIELLIVVAIIAILAAIAVPNFLEAQVRAKVTRCASDMRSIATALESYMVDYNVYPVSDYRWTHSDDAQRNLTTPVAYLASLPLDPFNLIGRPWNGQNGSDDDFYIPKLFAYMSYKGSASPPYRNRNSFIKDYKRWTGKDWTLSQGWQLRSLGPILDDQSSIPYDSTNGTKSEGDISRYNTGIEY